MTTTHAPNATGAKTETSPQRFAAGAPVGELPVEVREAMEYAASVNEKACHTKIGAVDEYVVTLAAEVRRLRQYEVAVKIGALLQAHTPQELPVEALNNEWMACRRAWKSPIPTTAVLAQYDALVEKLMRSLPPQAAPTSEREAFKRGFKAAQMWDATDEGLRYALEHDELLGDNQ